MQLRFCYKASPSINISSQREKRQERGIITDREKERRERVFNMSLATPSTARSVRTVPGSYGWPLVGAFSDRLDFSWFQGMEKFFKKRIEKYNSTVFRTNVPPSFPFFLNVNPNVVALVDCKSFSYLFDNELVDKKNTLLGDFMPSLKYTGNMRVCPYLDTTEPTHTKVKSFVLDILKRSSGVWVTELLSNLDKTWDTIEINLYTSKSKSTSKSSAQYVKPIQRCIFAFLSKSFMGADTSKSPKIAESGHSMVTKWILLQFLPTIQRYSYQPLVEIFFHSFTYPFALVSGDYKQLYNFFETQGKEVIERGETEYGLGHQETIHNLFFIMCLNGFEGFSILFPDLLSRIGNDPDLQAKLRNEVREKTRKSTSPTGELTLSFDSVRDMELVNSVVCETLRLNPPIPLQYGRARKDFVLSSNHDDDSVFEIKKGELLCGCQKVAMRDPKVFDDPDSFVADRFTSEKGGTELLKYLYWSNGPQTRSPTESDKQCAGKDYVVPSGALFIAHLFSRYDSVTCDSTSIIALEKAQ